MEHLQELINKRAEKIVDAQLDRIVKFLHAEAKDMFELGGKVCVVYNTTNGEIKEDLRHSIWSEHSIIFKEMKERMLPVEIEKQSKYFLNKVEELSREVEDLKSMNYD